jgi:hypothetical protein
VYALTVLRASAVLESREMSMRGSITDEYVRQSPEDEITEVIVHLCYSSEYPNAVNSICWYRLAARELRAKCNSNAGVMPPLTVLFPPPYWYH